MAKIVQIKKNETKSLWKYQSLFYAGYILINIGFFLEVWLIYLVRLLWRNWFFLSNKYQWQIASWRGVKAHVHLPFSELGPHSSWTCVGLACAATVLQVYMCTSPIVSGRYCFFRGTHDLWLLPTCHLLFHIDPWIRPGGRSWMKHPFRAECSKISLCTSSRCGSICWFPSTEGSCFPDEAWEKHWSAGIEICH